MRLPLKPVALAAALLLSACSTYQPIQQASAPDPQLAKIGQITVPFDLEPFQAFNNGTTHEHLNAGY